MPLSANILQALQDQYAHERFNEHRYMIRASFADYYGLTGIKTFFQKQAEDERSHAIKVYDYILDRGERISNSLPIMTEELPENLIGVFESALALETGTTEKLKSLYALACSEGDFLTSSWLVGGLLPEQVEEEDTLLTIIDRIRVRFGMTNLAGGNGIGPACDDGAALHDIDTYVNEQYNG